jgi:protein subunit release factor B
MPARPLPESELRETFLRASGPGGQNVNKVETGVLLTHIPTGLSVRVTDERSQAQNRALARKRLAERLAQREEAERARRLHAAELQRRRNRKRSRASKERMLEAKHRRARAKGARRVGWED